MAKQDPKYERIFKPKRYVSLKNRAAAQRSYCSRKGLQRRVVCSLFVESSDGTSYIVPSRIHLESWNESQRIKLANNEKTDLYPLPPCPVQVLAELGKNVCAEGFCTPALAESFTEDNDRKEYICYGKKEIAIIDALPKMKPDWLEPRPWISWSDCHIRACVVPADNHDWLENLPFAQWPTASRSDSNDGARKMGR